MTKSVDYPFFQHQAPLEYGPIFSGFGVVVMSGEKQVRRSTKLSNWMIGAGLAAVAVLAYVVIALRIHEHGLG
jgi:hypothetical protein